MWLTTTTKKKVNALYKRTRKKDTSINTNNNKKEEKISKQKSSLSEVRREAKILRQRNKEIIIGRDSWKGNNNRNKEEIKNLKRKVERGTLAYNPSGYDGFLV